MNRITRLIMGVMIITTTFADAQSREVNRMTRTKGNEFMTTISPVSLMSFNSPQGIIYLNISLDSINSEQYRVALYAYYPKAVTQEISNIIVGYTNGMADLLEPVYINREDNGNTYVEYYLKRGSKLMRNVGFEYLRFEHIVQIKKIDTPNYFKNFLRRY